MAYCNCVLPLAVLFYILTGSALKSFNLSALHLHLLFSVFFIIAILIFVKWYFVVLYFPSD